MQSFQFWIPPPLQNIYSFRAILGVDERKEKERKFKLERKRREKKKKKDFFLQRSLEEREKKDNFLLK